MSEKFSLKWNDYQSNWSRSLSKLRKETDFADVTLVTDDKVKFSAHKILLSSCSNTFKFILKDNTNVNTFIYLREGFKKKKSWEFSQVSEGPPPS